MADENLEGANVQEGQVAKKKGKPKLLLLIILVVFGLGLGGVYFFYGNTIVTMVTGKKAKPEAVEKEKRHEAGPILTLEPFVFNLSGAPSRFAKVSIGIELKNAKAEEETRKIMPAMRDKVLLILGGKPTETFLDVNQRNKIKEEVCEGLKGLFKEKSDLSTVYITDIIIQ